MGFREKTLFLVKLKARNVDKFSLCVPCKKQLNGEYNKIN